MEYISFLEMKKITVPEWYSNFLKNKNMQIFITNSKNVTGNDKLMFLTFSEFSGEMDVTKELYAGLLESYEEKSSFKDKDAVCIYAILNQDPTIVIGFAQILYEAGTVKLKHLATTNSVKYIKKSHLLRNKFYLIGSCMLTAISLYSSYLSKDIHFLDGTLNYYDQFIPYGLVRVNDTNNFIIPKDKIIPPQDYYDKKVTKLVYSNPRLHIIEHYMSTRYYINLVKKYNEDYITSPQSFNKFGFQSQPSLNKYLEHQKYQILKNYFKSWRVKVEDFKKVQYCLTTSVECSNKNCNQYIPLQQNKKVVFCSKCHTRTYVKSQLT
ncbi:hypothetical protein SD28_01680 [Allofrancisella guangzhouensis]|uniref:Uncharacterized protein n=2 Tax=Allofrancisella guangzhouensis TaxID=594679 RepID=A0A0A8E8I0_9GAMM|nr:hypothetical protein SD28_01680 [Allofrancisella guangzhouensis]